MVSGLSLVLHSEVICRAMDGWIYETMVFGTSFLGGLNEAVEVCHSYVPSCWSRSGNNAKAVYSENHIL